MTKYSTEFKMKVVKEYLQGNMEYISLAKKYNISNESVVRRWVNAFKIQGYDGLKVLRKKQEVLFRFQTNLYLTGERVSNMAKDSKKKSIKKSKSKKEIGELEKLKEENYYLKMEVEILKKRFNSLK